MIADILAAACTDMEHAMLQRPDELAECLDEVQIVLAAMRRLERTLNRPSRWYRDWQAVQRQRLEGGA